LRFKKIASVLASAAMVFSTVGFAAATTYPAPFVEDGVADAAIVYGSHPSAQSDMVAVVNIQNSLNSFVLEGSVSTPVSADCEGETCVKLDKSNDKINLGDTLTSAFGANIDKDDMATLLADGEYTADDNDDFEFEQKITLGADTFEHFRDSDYEQLVDLDERTPVLGFKYLANAFVLNYTLDFLQDAESTVTDGDLDDFEGSEITLFGQKYYISDAKNGTAAGNFGKFTLLDAANSAVVNEGETVNVAVGSTTYEVSATVFSYTETVLTVNGEITNGLNEGQTYKLSDGTYVGIKDIRYVSKETGVSQVEFSVGTGKIEMTTGSDIKINDDTIEGVKAYFHRGTASGDTQKLDKVVIEWKTDDEAFLTEESDMLLPGLETVALDFGAWVRPTEEKLTVQNDGSTSIELVVPIKDGSANINLLYAGTDGLFDGIGKAATERLATTSGSEIFYYNKKGGDNYHKYIVVSYESTDRAESYLLSFDNNEDDDAGRNETTIKNEVTGQQLKTDVTTGLYDTGIGDASFTINEIGYNSTDEWLNITAGSGTSFNELFTAGGLKLYLPIAANGTTAAATLGGLELDTTGPEQADAGLGHNMTSWWLSMEDEDKDDNIGGGTDFNITISHETDGELTVTQINTASGTSYEEIGDTDTHEYYVVSPPATRFLYKSESSNPDSVEIYYPEGESQSYAEIFLKATDAALGGDGEGGIGAPILDTEIAEAAGKNIVVVGGSCVNKVAAELLGRSDNFCGTEWTTATGIGADTFLIQTFARTGDKVATLVAGWSAIDTQNAATALTTQTVDTTAGKKYTGTTADSIESVM